MPAAEIITIGTELLLGEIVDTNARTLAKMLSNVGIDLFRTTTVGDNVKRIAQAIRESLERCDIVITTGGLGPTVDDPTREAVALAMGVELEYCPELWDQIQKRFERLGRTPTENNRRQAYIPKGAKAYENPVGTAPIFIVEHLSQAVIALPGVPSEMEHLMRQTVVPYLRERYKLQAVIKSRVLHTVGVGESQIDENISDLEKLTNPTVGLAAHSGQVDVRITAKAETEVIADALIQPIEETLLSRLGDWVYGTDLETLEGVSLRTLENRHWTLAAVEAGLGGNLVQRLAAAKSSFVSGQVLNGVSASQELLAFTESYRQSQRADVGLGVAILSNPESHDIHLVLITPLKTQQFHRLYGGPPEYASLWAFNQSLDLIRRIADDH